MDYRFRPLSKTCAATGQPLAPGSVCYSVLVERDGVYERLDYSADAWTGVPVEAIGFWQCVVPHPEAKDVHTVDPEALLQYFEQLVEESNPAQAKLLYVLALYLLQRRRLRLDGSHVVDDVEYLEVSGTRGEGPYDIPDQQLSRDEISELQAALNQQLTTQWNAA